MADAAKTARGAVAHLRRQLESAGGLIIGGVLNNSVPRHAGNPYPYFVRPNPGMRLDPGSVEDHPESDGGVPVAGAGKPRPDLRSNHVHSPRSEQNDAEASPLSTSASDRAHHGSGDEGEIKGAEPPAGRGV